MELTQDHCVKINSLEEYNRFAEIADQLGYMWCIGRKFTLGPLQDFANHCDVIIYIVKGTWSPANQLTSTDIKLSVEELESMVMVEKMQKFLETC